MGRKSNPRRAWLWRLFALLVLIALAAGGWLWWDMRHWTPAEEQYPDQGAFITQDEGAVRFETLKALGANFVYLEASLGAKGMDAHFSRNYAAARAAGLQIGAVHMFDPCAMADGQSANFVTAVPRARDLLPPAIALDQTADACPVRVTDAAVHSELMTLINQIETHAGKPVILKITPEFEAKYGLATRLDRNLWLNRTRWQPTYAGRPWLLWSANESLLSEASDRPIEWLVVQP